VTLVEALLRAQPILILLLTAFATAAAFILRAHLVGLVSGKAGQAEVDQIDGRVHAHDARLATIEAAIRHLPTADQMHALALRMEAAVGELRALAMRIDGVGAQVGALTRKIEMIDEHLKRAGA